MLNELMKCQTLFLITLLETNVDFIISGNIKNFYNVLKTIIIEM